MESFRNNTIKTINTLFIFLTFTFITGINIILFIEGYCAIHYFTDLDLWVC